MESKRQQMGDRVTGGEIEAKTRCTRMRRAGEGKLRSVGKLKTRKRLDRKKGRGKASI
jgi:hypothetical protein